MNLRYCVFCLVDPQPGALFDQMSEPTFFDQNLFRFVPVKMLKDINNELKSAKSKKGKHLKSLPNG